MIPPAKRFLCKLATSIKGLRQQFRLRHYTADAPKGTHSTQTLERVEVSRTARVGGSWGRDTAVTWCPNRCHPNPLAYQPSPYGSLGLDAFTDGPGGDPVSLAIRSLLGLPSSNLLVSAAAGVTTRALDNNTLVQSALDSQPPLATIFPDTYLGQQLSMIARLISIRSTLGLSRQIFFCAADGYDTHGGRLPAHADLLDELSTGLLAFYNATTEMGVASDVTSFTASDFGRTYPENGGGSGHGLGNHQLIVVGAVHGGDLYGQVPTLVVDGPDDAGEGRWIPTTSVDEYSATLARWFGVSNTDLSTVFPNLGRFNHPDLGFMG